MTPTLLGRWQQRLLLLPTVGLLLTLPLAIGQHYWPYLLILLYVGIGGCLWDCLYQQLQKMRWDGDWPGLWQLLGCVSEGLLLLLLLKANWLPGISLSKLATGWLLLHYIALSLAMYIASHSLIAVFFPHARYQGQQWL